MKTDVAIVVVGRGYSVLAVYREGGHSFDNHRKGCSFHAITSVSR
jgi:hypothetical protein